MSHIYCEDNTECYLRQAIAVPDRRMHIEGAIHAYEVTKEHPKTPMWHTSHCGRLLR